MATLGRVTAVSAIVVNYRRPELLRACLASLRAALDRVERASELVVVDNASGDDSCALVRREFPNVALVELPENRGFASAVNEGVRRSRGEWVALLNNDTTVEAVAIERLLEVGESGADVGAVAAQMRFADRPQVINSAGIGVDRLGIAYDRLLGAPVSASEREPVEVFGASGGAALYRRAMLEEIGGFDESFFMFLEDADVAWRARMHGWRCLYAPEAVVYHRHSATAGHGSDLKYFHVGLNRVRLLAKNADGGQLLRYGAAMVLYDLAYVAFAGVVDRTLAPLRGRVRGLGEWTRYRALHARRRRPVELSPVRGFRAALRRRAAY